MFGKKSYGKTSYILDRIKENKGDKILLLVPSHNTFMIENRVIKYLGEESQKKVQIMDFKKLTNRFLSNSGDLERISSNGKSLLIKYLLRGNHENIFYFSKYDKKGELNEEVLSLIMDFKNYNIDGEKLDNLMGGLKEDEELYKKLHDIKFLKGKYEEYIKDNYIDPLDDMKVLNDILLRDKSLFKDYDIYIDGFEIFTYYQYEFLSIILNRVKSITLSLTLSKDKNIIYKTPLLIKDKILNILFKGKVFDIKEVYLDKSIKDHDLLYLGENFTNYNIIPFDDEVKNIRINKCLNNYYEVLELSLSIRELVMNKGLRFKDIGVICRDIDSYENFIKVSFDDFNIPYFIDKKNTIKSNIFSIYLNSIFEIFEYNFSYNSLFKYIKSGILNIDDEDIYILENFSLENNIKGYKWLKDFDKDSLVKYTLNEDPYNYDLDRINLIREKIISPLNEFYKKVKGKHKAPYFVLELYNFLDRVGAINRVLELSFIYKEENQLFSKEIVMVLNSIFEVLDEINKVFKEEIMDFKEFSSILIDSINKLEVSNIPLRVDEIIIGDIERINIGDYKALFIIGCTSGVFPKAYKKDEILNDREKEYIKSFGYDFTGSKIDKNISERYLLNSMFNIPKDYLYISYSISNMDGTSLKPSIIINKIKRMFPHLKEENKTLIKDDLGIYSKKSTLSLLLDNIHFKNKDLSPLEIKALNYYYKDKDFKDYIERFIHKKYKNESLSKSLSSYVFSKTKFSVSSIESYSRCPFKYFLRYVVKLKGRKEYSFTSYEYGNITHYMLESICKTHRSALKNLSKYDIEALVESHFNSLIDKNYILNNNNKFRASSNKVKKILSNTLFYLSEHLKLTRFNHELYEFNFGLTLDIDNSIVNFKGKIDRIDTCLYKDETLINIIDYKSSIKDIDYGKIYKLLNIQILAYMKYILDMYSLKNIKASPCGVFYFTVHSPMVKNKGDTYKEKSKLYKYSGIMSDDLNKLSLIDLSINKDSLILPIKLTSKGDISKSVSKETLLNEKEFQDILGFVDKSIKDKIEGIYKGNIPVYPILDNKDDKKCTYCDYLGVCKFIKRSNNFDIIPKMKKEIFFNILGERDNSEFK